MADRGRFELPIRLPVCRISSAVHSTALPPVRTARALQYRSLPGSASGIAALLGPNLRKNAFKVGSFRRKGDKIGFSGQKRQDRRQGSPHILLELPGRVNDQEPCRSELAIGRRGEADVEPQELLHP